MELIGQPILIDYIVHMLIPHLILVIMVLMIYTLKVIQLDKKKNFEIDFTIYRNNK